MDELTRSLEILLQEIGDLGRGLEEQLARMNEEQRRRSAFAYLMAPAEAAE